MNGKIKALTLAIIAMFCLTAVICVAGDDNTSAADSVEHFVYIEVVNADHVVTDEIWMKFTSTTDANDFVEKANEAFKFNGYSEIVASLSGDYLSITYNGSYDTGAYIGAADKESWDYSSGTADVYLSAAYIAFELNKAYVSDTYYDSLTDDEKKNWMDSGMGKGDQAYVKIPAAMPKDASSYSFPETTTCHYFIETTSSDGTVKSSKWVEFDTLKTSKSLVANANETFKNEGLNNLEFSIGKYGITVTYDGKMDNVSYYADGEKWVKVTSTAEQYLSESVAFSVGYSYVKEDVYNKFTEDAKTKYVLEDMGEWGKYYYKTVEESTTGYEPAKSNNNTALIIGIVVVVAVLAVGIFFFTKKK